MSYRVKIPATIRTDSLDKLGDSVVNLSKWAEDEFNEVASQFQSTEPDFIWNSVPPKPRRGTYAYADGTNWNPGAGEGPYFYNKNGLWVPMQGALPSNLRGYIGGLAISTPGSSVNFTVTQGEAVDSSGTDFMTLSSTYTKNGAAAWSVGSGGGALDTGSLATGWYHVFLIKRPDTGVVDLLVSLSLTPTLPTGYTLFRRIGSLFATTFPVWLALQQIDDEFYWGPPIASQANVNPGTSLTSYTVGVPLGLSAKAILDVAFTNTASAGAVVYLWGSGTGDPSSIVGAYALGCPTAGNYTAGQFEFWTDTSSHIFAKCSTASNNSLYITTYGWRDKRGRDI